MKQLLKDLKRLLNDNRLYIDSIAKKDHIVITSVSFKHGNGTLERIHDAIELTYDNIFDVVDSIYRKHPTRNIEDVMYSIKWDTKPDKFLLGVTNDSNLELFNVKHRRVSKELRNAIDQYITDYAVVYKFQYSDKFISNFDRAGGYAFTLQSD